MRPASSTVQQVLRLSAAICARSVSSVSCSRPILSSPSVLQEADARRKAERGLLEDRVAGRQLAPGEVVAEIDDRCGAERPADRGGRGKDGRTLPLRRRGWRTRGASESRRLARRLARRMRSRTRARDCRRSGLLWRTRAGSCGFGTGTGSVVDAGVSPRPLSDGLGPALGSGAAFAAFAGRVLSGAPAGRRRRCCGACACRLGLVGLCAALAPAGATPFEASPCGARTGGAMARAAGATAALGAGAGMLGAGGDVLGAAFG